MTTPDDIQIVRDALEYSLECSCGSYGHEEALTALDRIAAREQRAIEEPVAQVVRQLACDLTFTVPGVNLEHWIAKIGPVFQRAYAAGQESMRERAAMQAGKYGCSDVVFARIRALEILPYGGER